MKHRYIYLLIGVVIIIILPVFFLMQNPSTETQPKSTFQANDQRQWNNEVIAYGEYSDDGMYRVYKYDPLNKLKKEILSFQMPSNYFRPTAWYREGNYAQFYLSWTNDDGKNFVVDVINETAVSNRESSDLNGEGSIFASQREFTFGKYTFVTVFEQDVRDPNSIALDIINNETGERSALLREEGVGFITFVPITNEIVFASSQYHFEAANIDDVVGSRRSLFKGASGGPETATIRTPNFSRDNRKIALRVNTFSGGTFSGEILRIIDFEDLSVIDEFPLLQANTSTVSPRPVFFGWFYAE